MSIPSTAAAYPHDPLTVIAGRPNNTTLQVLKRQLYANAGAIESTRGGGAHGHLALLLDPAIYLTLSNGIAFVAPVHPGPMPIHPAAATTAVRAEINRVYAQDITDFSIHNKVTIALQRQILAAVNPTYLRALEDPDYGFLQVTPYDMLNHLVTHYGTLTPQELEANRLNLSTAWNPDAPIEDLWGSVANIRRVASAGQSPIDDISAINILLTMFEKSGLLATTTEKFRLRPTNEWTIPVFTADVTLGNKERVRKLTAGTAGYHGAHAATTGLPGAPSALATTTPPPIASPFTHPAASAGEYKLYYCWSHGLTTFSQHTSLTCRNKKEGHKDTATISNQQGGNCFFRVQSTGPRQRPPATTN